MVSFTEDLILINPESLPVHRFERGLHAVSHGKSVKDVASESEQNIIRKRIVSQILASSSLRSSLNPSFFRNQLLLCFI